MSRRKKAKRGKQLCAAMKRDIQSVVQMYLAIESQSPDLAIVRVDAWIRKAYEPHRWLKAHRYAYMVRSPLGAFLPLPLQEEHWIKERMFFLYASQGFTESGKAALWLELHRQYDGLVPPRAYVVAGVEPPPQVNP